jgi:transcriptional regulator with XRE-family HTH domain
MDGFDRRLARQLGRRVRRRRHFLDLSQETLAHRAGIHRTQISLYETGRRMPLAATLVRLAAALELSTDQLLVGIEWEVPGPRPGDGAEEARDPDADPPGDADDARA